MNKILIALLLFSFVLTSCNVVVFEQPMPAEANEMNDLPENFLGEYRYYVDGIPSELIIGENYFIRDGETFYLSDSLVVKPFERGLIVSERFNNPTKKTYGKWNAYILTQAEGGGLNATLFSFPNAKNKKKILRKFHAELLVEDDNEMIILFKGNADEFKKLSKYKHAISVIKLEPKTD